MTGQGVTGPGQGRLFLFSLFAMTLIGPMSVHLFLPALANVRAGFQVSTGTAQLTLSLSLLALAVATPVFGSLADRFGRRPALLGGLALFTGGAVLASFATDIWMLIAGRVIQGLGAACGAVISRAIVRDVYGVDRLGQMIAYLTTAYVLGPMLGPLLGGFLVDGFGWRAVVILAAGAGALVSLISFYAVAETRPATGGGPRLLHGYGQLLGEARFALFALYPGLATGTFFTHASASAFLMDEVLHRPASEYGIMFLFGTVGFMLGNFVSGRIGIRVGRGRMVILGGTVMIVSVQAMSVLLLVDGMSWQNLFIPAFFITVGQGLGMPQAQAAAIATDTRLAGTASGIVLFLQFGLGAALSALVAYLADGTAIPMIAIMLTTSALSFACGATAVWLERRQSAKSPAV